MKLNRQGVRNLDVVGPKPKRGHVGRSAEQDRIEREGQPCSHIWQNARGFDGYEEISFRKCGLCGEVR